MALTTFTGPVVSQNGFLDSSFTTAERDAIVDPQAGLLIYNTTDNTYEVYDGSAWQVAFGGGGGTYTLGVDYSGTFAVSMANFTGSPNMTIQPAGWSNTSGFNTLKDIPIGTSVTVVRNDTSAEYTWVSTSLFVADGPSAFSANFSGSSGSIAMGTTLRSVTIL
jgi:hypothetical protein